MVFARYGVRATQRVVLVDAAAERAPAFALGVHHDSTTDRRTPRKLVPLDDQQPPAVPERPLIRVPA
jgi:hypothetical protein